MKILVAIACYGHNNDEYLLRLIQEYRAMPYEVDIVVVSNIPRDLDKNIEVLVGLPAKNPWTLPFAHKKVFAERLDRYDLFIYSEDDTLITQQNIAAFLSATQVLKEDEIAGFLRSEQAADGTIYYSTVHSHFRWELTSVRKRGEDTFAFFTNEHGACYILTQQQLRRCIASGGFLVPPHEGPYDLLVTAATDPYTQCGFKKLICISRLGEFTAKHLTNKYIGKTGLEKSQFDLQIHALLDSGRSGAEPSRPIRVESRLVGSKWSKSYYEPCRDDLLDLIPAGAQRVLSLGCGWGKTEEALVRKGVHVSAVTLDRVIGACAQARGIEVLSFDLDAAPGRLAGQRFGVLLISGLLHLIDDPGRLLRNYRSLLSENGLAVVSCPNMRHLSILWRRAKGRPELRGLGSYQSSGVHQTSHRMLRQWFRTSGFKVDRAMNLTVDRWKTVDKLTLHCLGGLCAEEVIVVGRR